MRTVLLPVKDFRFAKQRLAAVLDPQRRAGFARAMLSDVLRTISEARRPERVIVFTASEEVAKLARPYDFEIVQEVNVRGHSAAVNQMVDSLSAEASHILSIASDLPTMQAAEIDHLFDVPSAGVRLVPSRDGTGTNAALFVSPARIQMEYGAGSLQRHLSNASAAGFEVSVLSFPGIAFDIDTPEDLQMFLRQDLTASSAWRYLAT
jgi:2-phospho-L-lactate/phosphoenolpyruvate guanylyltransferase